MSLWHCQCSPSGALSKRVQSGSPPDPEQPARGAPGASLCSVAGNGSQSSSPSSSPGHLSPFLGNHITPAVPDACLLHSGRHLHLLLFVGGCHRGRGSLETPEALVQNVKGPPIKGCVLSEDSKIGTLETPPAACFHEHGCVPTAFRHLPSRTRHYPGPASQG